MHFVIISYPINIREESIYPLDTYWWSGSDRFQREWARSFRGLHTNDTHISADDSKSLRATLKKKCCTCKHHNGSLSLFHTKGWTWHLKMRQPHFHISPLSMWCGDKTKGCPRLHSWIPHTCQIDTYSFPRNLAWFCLIGEMFVKFVDGKFTNFVILLISVQ